MSIQNRRVSLYDDGDRAFSTTTFQMVRRSMCGALSDPKATTNRVLRVHDTVTTQNRLFTMARRAAGTEGWIVNGLRVGDILASSWGISSRPKWIC